MKRNLVCWRVTTLAPYSCDREALVGSNRKETGGNRQERQLQYQAEQKGEGDRR